MGRPRKNPVATTAVGKLTETEKDILIERLLQENKELSKYNPNLDDKSGLARQDDRDIRPDEYINVMSLLPYTLQLTTETYGGGKVMRFTRFGETKRILIRMVDHSLISLQLFFQIHSVAPHARAKTQMMNAAARVTHDQWFL